MITPSDTILYKLSDAQIKECIQNAFYLTDFITDRSDLHSRSFLENLWMCFWAKSVKEWS